jgi:nifR3 family TIM-barrel protein
MPVQPISIGKLKLENNVFLAPLAAVNCPAFRLQCRMHGAALTYTQLIDSDGCMHNYENSYSKYIEPLAGERPLGIQLVGSQPRSMKAAAEKLEQHADLLDINMGCSESEVLAKKAGSFFMKHPEQIERVVSAVIGATNRPVTAKIRSGWDSINAPEVARMLEDCGVDAVAVHARTRKQKFTGKADWSVISHVSRAVDIPVIGNGDVTGLSSAQGLLEKCDAIMVGRAAMGNPLIFDQILRGTPSPGLVEKRKAFLEFVSLYHRQQRQRIPEVRQHALWFFKGVRGAARIKDALAKMDDINTILSYVKQLHQ